MNGCNNCKYYKVYRSNSYWDPDESECISEEVTEDELDAVYSDGLEWGDDEEPKCLAWKEAEYEVWD